MCNPFCFGISQNLDDGLNYGTYVKTIKVNAILFTNSIIGVSIIGWTWSYIYFTFYWRS